MKIELSDVLVEMAKEYNARIKEVDIGDEAEWASIKLLACRICNRISTSISSAEIEEIHSQNILNMDEEYDATD